LRLAIVHDWLTNMGGAEKLILLFKEVFPDAPIYTLVYDAGNVDPAFGEMEIDTSFIQKLPGARKYYRKYLPFFPIAVEQFDLREFDVVLSSSTSVAKGVITTSDTLHICYCNTPMRYAWDFYHQYLREAGAIQRLLIPFFMNYIRIWDRLTAERVDYFIANSNNVAKRIEKHYRRTSQVIYPPVDTQLFKPVSQIEDYYLVVSRLVPYKRIDLAVKAFNKLNKKLVIIGDGPGRKKLQAVARDNVIFMGRLNDEETRRYLASCRALIFPGEEDFGITPLEAQSCGRPVIAYGKGGALETVIDGKTGLFFAEQSEESLVDGVKRFESMEPFDKDAIRDHARQFDVSIFKKSIKEFVERKYREKSVGLA